MKWQKAVTAALRTWEISREREWEMEGRMERWRKEEKGGAVFYVTAVPYCPQKMSLCPWEAELGGGSHLSDHI